LAAAHQHALNATGTLGVQGHALVGPNRAVHVEVVLELGRSRLKQGHGIPLRGAVEHGQLKVDFGQLAFGLGNHGSE